MIIGDKTVCGKLISDLTSGSEKQIKVQCEDCKNIRTVIYNNYTRSQKRIHNNTGETPCQKCSTRRTGLAKQGKPSPTKGIARPHLQREKSSSWKGGSFISKDGYRMIYVPVENPKSKWESYKKEHIYIMEQKLNRKMNKDEVIHHINGNKLDNRLENLIVFNSDREHRMAHNQLERLSMSLVQQNIIVYNQTTNEYMAHSKLRELLEQLEEANQQPSPESNLSEGSTTSKNVLHENMNYHERGAEYQ